MERGDYKQNKGYSDNKESRHQKHKQSRSRSKSQERHGKGHSSHQSGQYDYHPPQQEERRQSRFGKQEFNQQQDRQQEQANRFSQRQEKFQEKPERVQERQERFSGKNYQFQERQQERFQQRQDRFQERPDRFQDRQDRQEKQDRFQDRQEKQDRFQDKSDRFQDRQDRFQDKLDRFQNKSDRFQDKQDRFQDKLDRFQNKSDRFQDKPDKFQDRQDRFQDKQDRFQDKLQDRQDQGGRDRNQNFQRQSQFQDQQENFQQRRQYGGRGNRQQGRQQFNKGRQNRNQQQEQQQQPPQKLYYYEQLQQQSQEMMKNFEAQQQVYQQITSGEIQDQQQQQYLEQQGESGSMIENLNEIEKLKNEFDPQKSQQQFQEQIQETVIYKWDQWQNDEIEPYNAMDNELDKLLGKRVKVRIPPDIAKNMGNINIQITKTEEMPEIQEEFKLTEKEQEKLSLIEQLTPYQQQWENLTSLLINEFELIDMFRKPEIASKRYSNPIVNYSQGSSKLGQIFTRDYFKLWELLFRFKLLDKFDGLPLQIANLSEGQNSNNRKYIIFLGPGGFINCLIDYRNRQVRTAWKLDKYVAMTPKNKDKKNQQIFDWDYFKTKKYLSGLDQQGYSIKLTYGASQDGDMLNSQNLIFFINYELKDKVTNQIKKCHIVTANGGTEFSLFNDEYQHEELNNAKLFFAEVATALSIQEKGGFFIIKIFNMQYEITRNIITLLAKYYKKVFIVKPYISHLVSSERYIVCDDFIGIDQNVNEKLLGILQEWMESENQFDYQASEMFFNKFLEFEANENSKFIENLKKQNEEIISEQVEKLKYSLNLLTNPVTPDIIKNIKQNQFEQAKKWCIKFEIPYLFKLDA